MERKSFSVVILIVVMIMALLAGCGGGASSSALNFQTEPLQKGDLTAQVIANGAVRPNLSSDLSWQVNGIVESVNANLGDMVEQGQVLASLRTDSLPQQVIAAKAELYQAQQALDDLTNSSDEKAAAANLDLANARKALEDARQKRSWLTADRRLVNPTTIDTARAELAKLEAMVEDARGAYEGLGYLAEDDPVRLDAKIYWLNLKTQRDQAKYQLEYLTGKPTEQEIAQADAVVAAAEADLNRGQATYDQWKNGVPQDELVAAQARVDSAQAALKLAQLTAPFAGMVTVLDTRAGDETHLGSTAFRVEDRSHMYVDVSISEMDINRVQAGQDVTVTLDAAYGQEYPGRVVEVGISGNSLQGLVSYPVTVELVKVDSKIKTGMTAAVHIQVDSVKDVLMVPNKAVRMVDGQRVVYVIKAANPLPQKVVIKLGVSSETMSQVLEGDLQVGDKVVLNPDMLLQPSGMTGQ
mgnify:CR=1 FL=1